MRLLPSILALCATTAATAQTVLYIPDNNPAVGICNAIPLSASFGQGSMTYVGRIPASLLDPNNRTIRDLEFAPCLTTTFTAANMNIGIGHVPASLSLPFAFPGFDAAGNVTTLGGFLDYAPLYNSVVQGPFTYAMTLDTWSPMGLTAGPWTGFTWNGIDDIGVYITYSGGVGGATVHRTTTEPFRLFASGSFQAAASSGSGAAGAKIGLVTGFPSACGGCGPVSLGLSGSPTLGGTLTASLAGVGPGLPFLGVDFGPFCVADLCPGCTIGHGWPAAIFTSSISLGIPNAPIYIGLQVGFQGIGLLTPGGCVTPPVAFSNTVVVTIGP